MRSVPMSKISELAHQPTPLMRICDNAIMSSNINCMLTRSYHSMSKAPHSCRLRIFHVFKINSNKKLFYDSSTFLFFVFRFAQHAQHLEIYVFLAVDSSTHGPGRREIVFRAKPGGNWETSRFSLRFSLTHSRLYI